MESEDDLLDLLLKSPNSKRIQAIAEQLEIDNNFSYSKDRNDLKGVWELRWSSSNSPFLKYSPFIDNLQILDPLNLNGLNLLKPRGIKSIIGTGFLIRLNYINEKKKLGSNLHMLVLLVLNLEKKYKGHERNK